MDSKIPLTLRETKILKQSGSIFCSVLQEKFGCTAEIHNVDEQAASSFAYSKATFEPEIKYSKQLSKNLKVSVWKDDLTTHKAEAVVNAANTHLSHGAGLALALSQAGGPTIQKESNDIIKHMGVVPTGDVVFTTAGNLPCKMIIHAVGPCVPFNPSQREIDQASALLHKTIWNILVKSAYQTLESVAIPAISSGLYNFPRDLCADIIVKAVKSYSQDHNKAARSLEVRLVNNDDPSVSEMHKACRKILGPSDQIPQQNPSSASSQVVLNSVNLGNVTLQLKKGAIEEEKADVIVNTAGADLNLSAGLVSIALLKKAGPKIQDELKKQRRGHASPGEVFITDGYNLNCKAVYHVICAWKKSANSKQILYDLINRCLKTAVSQGHSSIHFPAIGTGNLGFEKDEVSEIMTQAVLNFSKKNQRQISVCFVIFSKDTETMKAFEKQMDFIKKTHSSNMSSRTTGKSSSDYDEFDTRTPFLTLFAPSQEALREAQSWCLKMLHEPSAQATVNNNHVVYFGQKNLAELEKLQVRFNVVITVFLREGKGGIIINGDSVGVGCALLEVEAMLCQVQEDFAQTEEKNMQSDLEYTYMADYPGQQEHKYLKTQVDLNSQDRTIKDMLRNFARCDLSIVKVEKIENPLLKQVFELKCRQIKSKPQHLYQCVTAQFCNLICRVGFQREYAPPKEQKYGAGIYFTTKVETAQSLWMDSEEEYFYFFVALVLTGKETRGSSEMIVPPPTGKDTLIRFDSLSSGNGTYVICNGQQAYPQFLITCKKQKI